MTLRTLDGATALVTGAGRGIGQATCRELERRGATVLAVDIDSQAAALSASACGGGSYQVDVADRAAMEEMAASVLDDYGPPDLLVNNAGVGMTGRFLDMDPEDWDWILDVNLRGVINGCRAFAPGMLERGSGHVVNLSSGLGYTPRATEPGYVTSKAAVLALSLCLRADWARRGVGVSAICPGVINTPIVDHTRYLGDRSATETVSRVRRVFSRGHRPEKVARAIVAAALHDRPVVPVGAEAWVGWGLHRLLPSRAAGAMARSSFGGL